MANNNALEHVSKGKPLAGVLELPDNLSEHVGISLVYGHNTRPGVHESHPSVAHNSVPVTQSERGAPFDPDAFYEAPGILRLVTRTPLMATLRSGFVFATL